jgi:phage terminase large subunit-like protein
MDGSRQVKRVKADNFEVYFTEDPPEKVYTVGAGDHEVTFMLNGVYFGELHKRVQAEYVSQVRKSMLAHGIKLHGPTLVYYLKQVGR